jgi:hypothetical protein
MMRGGSNMATKPSEARLEDLFPMSEEDLLSMSDEELMSMSDEEFDEYTKRFEALADYWRERAKRAEQKLKEAGAI